MVAGRLALRKGNAMKRTPEQMVEALAELFDAIEDEMTREEVDDELRAWGYDLEEPHRWAEGIARMARKTFRVRRRKAALARLACFAFWVAVGFLASAILWFVITPLLGGQ